MTHRENRSRDERWELASRAANEGIWDWDMRTNQVYRSEHWFRMFGYEPGELADTPWVWENLIHPDDASRVIEQRRRHIEGAAERYYVEHRMRCKDGEYRWFLSRGQVIRDEAGTPVRMLGFYTNIQETIENRARLLRQNAALQILNEVSLQAIATDAHDVTLTAILNRIREYMGAEKGYLALHDPEEDVMRTHSLSGQFGPFLTKIRRGEHFVGLVWQAGEYQYKDHFNEWTGRADTPDASPIRTACGLPLKLGKDIVGVIVLAFFSHREVSDEEAAMLHQFAAIAALVVRNRQMAIRLQDETEQRASLETTLQHNSRTEFLNALADGKPMTSRVLAAQARIYGLTSKSGYLTAVAHCDCDRLQPVIDPALLPDTVGTLILWRREGNLYLIQPQAPPDHDRLELAARAEELRRQLAAHLGCDLCCIGVGLHCSGLRDIAVGFRQAREALDLGCRIHPSRTVHHYLDIGILQVLSRQGDREQVEDFIRHTIGKLIDYDKQKNGHLLETLAAILNGSNLRVVAEELFIHTKTLLFRKNRIEEILGESLDDSSVRMNLTLALQLHGLKSE